MGCIALPKLPSAPDIPGFSLTLAFPVPSLPTLGLCCNITIPDPLKPVEDYIASKAKALTLGATPPAALAAGILLLNQGIAKLNGIIDSLPPKCPRE